MVCMTAQGQMMKSVTYSPTSSNDLTVAVETNTRFCIYSIAASFLTPVTGNVTVIHYRGTNYNVNPLKLMAISGSNSAVCYFDAPYVIDGKQGDWLKLSTTNCGTAGKMFFTIMNY